MNREFTSKVFVKIQKSIETAQTEYHLVGCRQMIENATPILGKDSIELLKSFLLAAWDRVRPQYMFEEEMEKRYVQLAMQNN